MLFVSFDEHRSRCCWVVGVGRFRSIRLIIFVWHRLVDRVGGLAVIETRLAKKIGLWTSFFVELVTVNAFLLGLERDRVAGMVRQEGSESTCFSLSWTCLCS